MKSLTTHLRRRTTSGNWIPELDGLRFVAIVSVVLFHLQGQLLHHGADASDAPYITRLFGNGNRGVPLFFLISGFILARPFAEHYLFARPYPSLRKYFTRRVTRLEPPYIVNLLLIGGFLVFVEHQAWRVVLPHVMASMVYLHYAIYHTFSTINSVAWSLEIEVQFYILAPLLAMLFAVKHPAGRRILMLVLMAAAAALQIAAHLGPATLAGQLQYFLAGLLFADMYLLVLPRWKHTWKWDVLSLAGWPTLFLLAENAWVGLWLPFLTLLLCIAAFRGVAVYAALRQPWVAVIGGMCYTIYLWHAPVMTFVQRLTAGVPLLNPRNFGLLFLVEGILKVLAIAAVSLTLFLLVERPCMDSKWPQKLWARLHGRHVATAPLPAIAEET